MNTLPNGDRLLPLPEVADLLSVSVKTIRRLIEEEKLKSIKVRGVRRVWLNELKRYLKSLEPVTS